MGSSHGGQTQPHAPLGHETAQVPANRLPVPLIQNTVGWDRSVIGQADAKHALENAFFLPRKFPGFFGQAQLRIKQRGILLWGPPGTGKTMIARSFARAHNARLVEVEPGTMLDKYVGETETKVKNVFQDAKSQKTVVFMDEIDSFLRKRVEAERSHERSTKVQFMLSIDDFLDNATADSCLVACTNSKSELDPAVLRRFKIHIFCGLPSIDERRATVAHFCKDLNTMMTEDDFDEVARRTPFYSGSDLKRLVDLASMGPTAELQAASHFIQDINGKYMPSTSDVVGAVRLRLVDMEEDALGPMRPIARDDFCAALIRARSTLTKQEYAAYLKEKQDSEEEVTTRVTDVQRVADKFELELQQVFASMSPRLPKHFAEAQHFANYARIAAFPGSELHSKKERLTMVVLVMMVALAFVLPSLFWILCAIIAGFYIMNAVILPLYTVWITNIGQLEDDINQSEGQVKEMLLIFVFCVVVDTPLFKFSQFALANALVMSFFLFTMTQFATTIIHFIAMRLSRETGRILANAGVVGADEPADTAVRTGQGAGPIWPPGTTDQTSADTGIPTVRRRAGCPSAAG